MLSLAAKHSRTPRGPSRERSPFSLARPAALWPPPDSIQRRPGAVGPERPRIIRSCANPLRAGGSELPPPEATLKAGDVLATTGSRPPWQRTRTRRASAVERHASLVSESHADVPCDPDESVGSSPEHQPGRSSRTMAFEGRGVPVNRQSSPARTRHRDDWPSSSEAWKSIATLRLGSRGDRAPGGSEA